MLVREVLAVMRFGNWCVVLRAAVRDEEGMACLPAGDGMDVPAVAEDDSGG